jgi:hypothetical protein
MDVPLVAYGDCLLLCVDSFALAGSARAPTAERLLAPQVNVSACEGM